MEGRREIVIDFEKVFTIITQYFDLITTNQIDYMYCIELLPWNTKRKSQHQKIICPIFLVAYDPTHDMPYSFV